MIALFLLAALASLFLGILGTVVLFRAALAVAFHLENVIGYALYGTIAVLALAALGAGLLGTVSLVILGIETLP